MKEDFTIHICNSKEEFAIARNITPRLLEVVRNES